MVGTVAGSAVPAPGGANDSHEDSFRLVGDETVAGLLDIYDYVAQRTEEIVEAIDDLGATFPAPTFPWFPTEGLRWSPRWVLLHLIEEVGRHAGHADIIRETLDGTQAFALIDALDESRVGAGGVAADSAGVAGEELGDRQRAGLGADEVRPWTPGLDSPWPSSCCISSGGGSIDANSLVISYIGMTNSSRSFW